MPAFGEAHALHVPRTPSGTAQPAHHLIHADRPWIAFPAAALPPPTHPQPPTPLTEKYSMRPMRKGELPFKPDTLVQKMESGGPPPRAAAEASAARCTAPPGPPRGIQGSASRLRGRGRDGMGGVRRLRAAASGGGAAASGQPGWGIQRPYRQAAAMASAAPHAGGAGRAPWPRNGSTQIVARASNSAPQPLTRPPP